MNARRLVVALLLVYAVCGSFANGLQIKGTGIQHPDGIGWQHARPTGGGFSVLLPCPYSDQYIEGDSGAVINSRMVVCRLSEDVLFEAVQFEYATPEVAAQWFAKMAAMPGAQPISVTPAGYRGHKTIAPPLPKSLVNLTGSSRAVLAGSAVVVVDVEWRPVEVARVKPMIQKFFDSLQVDN